MTPKRSFSHFVEDEMGKFPHFLIFAVLEWVLIGLLFLDGLVAFVANRFAGVFGLRTPCLLCTRIDRVVLRRDRDRDDSSYLDASLCEPHKARLSSLAFCRAHRRLSDARRACEPCLLSLSDNNNHGESDGGDDCAKWCSCCGEAMATRKASASVAKGWLGGLKGGRGATVYAVAAAPAPSPRGRFSMRRRGSDVRYDYSEVVGDRDDKFREDLKAAMVPLLTAEPYDPNDESNKTPSSFARSVTATRFFGIPLTDSASNSPRLASRLSRESPLEKTEPASSEDSKSLMALYSELDEERSASAVAANNAMAMITRLQAEKAAVQMEALQYQRMMEEQFEYDQEALQETNDLLLKREEEVRALEAELEAYRERYGWLKEDDDDDDDGVEISGREIASSKQRRSSDGNDSTGTELESSCFGESLKDFKEEKTYFLGKKRVDKVEDDLSENGVASLELNGH